MGRRERGKSDWWCLVNRPEKWWTDVRVSGGCRGTTSVGGVFPVGQWRGEKGGRKRRWRGKRKENVGVVFRWCDGRRKKRGEREGVWPVVAVDEGEERNLVVFRLVVERGFGSDLADEDKEGGRRRWFGDNERKRERR
ncbi:hypothetical protein HAX54_033040 [Datura stramonium]|uniref:Uncharacterized protein n=1 Tax=Datura stramonium TaxID=4076 RepID=A0ABS8VBR9_DATST|nr:hypothetical protein [Datura stramonium]